MHKLELVDGQQRLTTISILLLCILDRLKRDGEQTEAQDIERLLQAKALGSAPLDSARYRRVRSTGRRQDDRQTCESDPCLSVRGIAKVGRWAEPRRTREVAQIVLGGPANRRLIVT